MLCPEHDLDRHFPFILRLLLARIITTPLLPLPRHDPMQYLPVPCLPKVEEKGHRHHVPHLRACIAKVPRLLGCESAYYFPKDLDVCEGLGGGGGGRGGATEDNGFEEEKEGEAGGVEGGLAGGQKQQHKGAGNLVIHIRSGDIFSTNVLSYYGQVSSRVRHIHT